MIPRGAVSGFPALLPQLAIATEIEKKPIKPIAIQKDNGSPSVDPLGIPGKTPVWPQSFPIGLLVPFVCLPFAGSHATRSPFASHAVARDFKRAGKLSAEPWKQIHS